MKIQNSPPRLFHRFFRWFCHPTLLPGVEGDLMELYNERLAGQGKRKADRRFIIDVLLLFRPGIIRPAEGAYHLNNYGMFKNYLKIAYRNMTRHRLFSLINVSGMAVGLAIGLLILTHLRNEFSYENAFPKHELIYRVASTNWAKMPPVVAQKLKDEMPEIKQIGRLYFLMSRVMGHGEN